MKILNKKIAAHKSSVAWLQRQASDPYVERAHKEGYRARAAYKLIEMNEKFHFLKNGQVVVDLGAAPGAWWQCNEFFCVPKKCKAWRKNCEY